MQALAPLTPLDYTGYFGEGWWKEGTKKPFADDDRPPLFLATMKDPAPDGNCFYSAFLLSFMHMVRNMTSVSSPFMLFSVPHGYYLPHMRNTETLRQELVRCCMAIKTT